MDQVGSFMTSIIDRESFCLFILWLRQKTNQRNGVDAGSNNIVKNSEQTDMDFFCLEKTTTKRLSNWQHLD